MSLGNVLPTGEKELLIKQLSDDVQHVLNEQAAKKTRLEWMERVGAKGTDIPELKQSIEDDDALIEHARQAIELLRA